MLASLTKQLPVQIFLGVILFLSVAIVSDRFTRGIRLDLTEDKLFTLSEGSKALLTGLEEEVTFDFYFSRTLATPYPQILNYGKRVEDMLRALAAASDGKIILSFVDPEPFSENEDDAVEAGLQGIPLSDGSTIYMGLSISDQLDGKAIISFFAEERENFLEYDLIKAIATLDDSAKKNLSLLTSLPMQYGAGGPQAAAAGRAQPYVIYQQLGEFFNVEDMASDFTEIPAETDVLMVVHPPSLSDTQLFQIEQYVLKGGRALFFLDPHSEAMDPRAFAPNASTLGPLLKAWGVDMPEGKVVGDASMAQRVQMGGVGADAIKDYIVWMAIRSDFISREDVVTGTIDNLNFATAGVLEPLEGATTKFEALVTTSAVAMLYDAQRVVGQPDPDALIKDLVATGKNYALTARVSGPANTAFPDLVSAETGPIENAPVAQGTINIVIGSDTDIFEDRFWVQLQELLGQRIVVPLAGNGSFILNLADHISGSDALLALRARGISKRSFGVVDALRRDAESRYSQEEQVLQNQLQETEIRIAELEAQKPQGTAVLSSEQEAEIEKFRAELLKNRKALREVKRSLRQEIEGLGKWLAFLNIALVPIIIVLGVLLRLMMRRRKAAREAARAA
ncbi:MAG: Gldg family protein [Kordiimonadaceae bacterium]|nr:Gldg family protein [Kordiimonadaceae bacterium]